MAPPDALRLSAGPVKIKPGAFELLAKGDIRPFKENYVFADFRLDYLDAVIEIPDCPIVAASEAFVRVTTFPVLYGIDAFQSVEDQYMDIRSTFDGRELRIGISSHRPKIEVGGDPITLIRTCGDFHKSVLRGLFIAVPDLRKYGYALTQITDAFALVFSLDQPSL